MFGPNDLYPEHSPRHNNQNAATMANNLLTQTLSSDPTLLPADPSSNPINSRHIDAIAHSMWQIAFERGDVLQAACHYSAMFAQLKLSALAKLNFLPSWWFLREMVVKILGTPLEQRGMGWNVDDAEMEAKWIEACHWARGAMERHRRAYYGAGGRDDESG